MTDNNNKETVLHATDTFRVIQDTYTLQDGSLINWQVKHNIYDTVEAEYKCMVDALKTCELLQAIMDSKSYLRSTELEDIISSIQSEGAQVIQLGPKSEPAHCDPDDDDEDPSIN